MTKDAVEVLEERTGFSLAPQRLSLTLDLFCLYLSCFIYSLCGKLVFF